MSKATATRRPTAATMRKMTGVPADATPAELVKAWEAIGSPRTLADVPAREEDSKPAATKPATTGKPAASKPAATPANCGCGCGSPTITSKATFLAGHDARHAGTVGRGLAATPDDADLKAAYDRMTDALKAKTDKIRATAEKANAVKEARRIAKEAYEAALAAI